jgi:hypothetical protein
VCCHALNDTGSCPLPDPPRAPRVAAG